MNRKVIVTLVLTVLALSVLTLFSFGPWSGTRKKAKINSASLKPSSTEEVVISSKNISFNVYRNKDLKENFYSVKFPQDWHLEKRPEPGTYSLSFNGDTATVELMDVPDNTTLELYVLSQEEPRLKRTVQEYQRIDYKKMMVGSADVYQLAYAGKLNGENYQAIRTYITGPDRACLITLSARQNKFTDLEAIYSSIIMSFRWENN